ncbi:MAG: PAS domain-containing protein [Rhodospirillales bacterium]|nr:PAS domain-containing protein [Rhodospirillales bacterium]
MTDRTTLIGMLDDLDDGVCLIDGADTIVALNNACARIFGCAPEDAVGHPLAVFGDLSKARVRSVDDDTRLAVFPRRDGNVELESFAYIVSHDLKEPLRAMSVFADALADDYGDALDHTGREYVNYITGGARRMSRMVDDLLEYTRVGRGGLTLQQTSLDDVVRDTLDELAEQVKATAADVTVESVLGDARVDRRVYSHALRHLIRNALAYVDEGTPPAVRIAAGRSGGKVALTVTDNGIGIRSSRHDRIFDVFERFGPRGEYAGSGVGLAIALKAMRLHGGDVTLSSEPGRGSVFRLEVPDGA